ncbi:MAG: hypothetical protein LPK45_00180 [Bacteroidota bacterium]|nr:hypothetical protein [Bacteroidota bacterium]MDX5429439.1 hypothetical protein [Bacteroidota bacterium]MDX5468228.1 hypothetical protein [Bacteroidota bacterium]
MIARIHFAFLLLLVSLTGIQCREKAEIQICQSSECQTYYSIWKNILMKQNNLTEYWFNQHIDVKSTSISDWKDGRTFRVTFDLVINWARVPVSNQIIIEIKDGAPPYPSLNLPKNKPLNQEEIERALTLNAHSSSLYTIDGKQSMRFKNEKEALNHLRARSGIKSLSFSKLQLPRSSFAHPTDGRIELHANGLINKDQEDCVDAILNLHTGEYEVYHRPCRVF